MIMRAWALAGLFSLALSATVAGSPSKPLRLTAHGYYVGAELERIGGKQTLFEMKIEYEDDKDYGELVRLTPQGVRVFRLEPVASGVF